MQEKSLVDQTQSSRSNRGRAGNVYDAQTKSGHAGETTTRVPNFCEKFQIVVYKILYKFAKKKNKISVIVNSVCLIMYILVYFSSDPISRKRFC